MQNNSEDGSPNEAPIQSVELSDEIPLVAALIENLEQIIQYIGNTTVNLSDKLILRNRELISEANMEEKLFLLVLLDSSLLNS